MQPQSVLSAEFRTHECCEVLRFSVRTRIGGGGLKARACVQPQPIAVYFLQILRARGGGVGEKCAYNRSAIAVLHL